MPNRPILFSVAHSSAAPGAEAKDQILTEYMVSLRASLAAVRNLAGDFAVEFLDVGALKQNEYDDAKIDAVNRCQPKLAIEIHCNAAATQASYGEVLHHRESLPGKEASSVIARTLAEGFTQGQHRMWLSRGARANTVEKDKHLMFFLERTKVPSIIIEGLFISNDEQAAWLANGGSEAYGLLVAEGVRRWLAGAKA